MVIDNMYVLNLIATHAEIKKAKYVLLSEEMLGVIEFLLREGDGAEFVDSPLRDKIKGDVLKYVGTTFLFNKEDYDNLLKDMK